MKRTFAVGTFAVGALIAGLSLGAPAFAESLTEKTGVNEMLGVSPSTSDFVTEAAIGGMFEIQSSEIAKQKGSSAEQSFAERMIEDHTKASNELKSLVQNGSVRADLPTALDGATQKKLDQLKGLSGAEFDKTYADDQVSAHKDAVSLFERYAKGGDNEALRQWASATLPTLRGHLEMAQDMRRNRVATP